MSNTSSSSSIGSTLAGGIQDVSAILPLIGTAQCEKHVGSALKGGYLYAAAAPLSIFGSLGTVKAGISILVSSISISMPPVSISFHNFKPSVKYLGKKKLFGGKMLKDAGFELTGTVAPLIGMDGDRFKAESRLIQILEEKHIDDPEKISIRWKSRKWNIMLILFTVLAAALSAMPYVALLHGPASWRPKHVHLPWLYPALRIAGSCGAAVTSQFIIQSRVISLMKSRIIFMIMQQRLDTEYKKQFDAWLKDHQPEWDSNRPAEQCIASLQQHLFVSDLSVQSSEESMQSSEESSEESVQSSEDPADGDHRPTHAASTTDGGLLAHHSIPITTPRSLLSDLYGCQQKHFPHPTREAAFILVSWIILGLSLPATVAGYIGCFTLISATPSPSNGPLVWVGLEVALSILRVFIWASNPEFDEGTEVTVELTLSEHQPMVTTNDYNPFITDSGNEKCKPFTLVPENEFLAHITPFTGPLDQFQKASSVTLYFTLTAKCEYHTRWSFDGQSENVCLFITLFDFNMQLGVTLAWWEMSFQYYNVAVRYNTVTRMLEARVQSEKSHTHPWPMENDDLFNSLETYYHKLASALKKRASNTASRQWKWDLSPQSGLTNQKNSDGNLSLLSLTHEDELYLNRGYERHLKSELIKRWGDWLVADMEKLRSHTRLDCHKALKDATSRKARWELTELDVQLVREWQKRESLVLLLSLELEDTLQEKMESCISEATYIRGEGKLRMSMLLELDRERRKWLQQERAAAKQRMEKAMEEWSTQADTEKRSWKDILTIQNRPGPMEAIDFIDAQWAAGIAGQSLKRLQAAEVEVMKPSLSRTILLFLRCNDSTEPKGGFLERWRSQYRPEIELMKVTIEHVRRLPANSQRNASLDMAYKYPYPDSQATAKFAYLIASSTNGKVCSALVYDADRCSKEAVCEVIAKVTTRSVANVDPEIVASIPPNQHLLFLSCEDGKGTEPPFVQQNRDRWWSQQTTNSTTFYFTPHSVSGDSCGCRNNQTIAHILIFLTASSTVRVRVLHNAQAIKVSLLKKGEELACISTVLPKFQLEDFPMFELPSGNHELELVPQLENHLHIYKLRDILIELSDSPGETTQGALAMTEDVTLSDHTS